MAKAKSQKINTGRTKTEVEEVPISIVEVNHPRRAGKMIKITTTSKVTHDYFKSIGDHIRMVESTSKATKITSKTQLL